ncbi:MAG: hypothetical protein J7L14_00685, partial [Candidatus Diapherotrites archaeon]|nr:hypothetical protein [Candidatus Diapherotrites archaeon]
MLELILSLILFVVVGSILAKRFLKAENYFYAISLVRTKKAKQFAKRLKQNKILFALAKIGLALSLGIFSFDYVYFRKKPLKKRACLNLLSLALLAAIFFVWQNTPLLGGLTFHPLVRDYSLLFALSFMFFGFAGFVIASLAAYSLYIISALSAGQPACPGIVPVVPGIKIPKVNLLIPLHGWISIFIILL